MQSLFASEVCRDRIEEMLRIVQVVMYCSYSRICLAQDEQVRHSTRYTEQLDTPMGALIGMTLAISREQAYASWPVQSLLLEYLHGTPEVLESSETGERPRKEAEEEALPLIACQRVAAAHAPPVLLGSRTAAKNQNVKGELEKVEERSR